MNKHSLKLIMFFLLCAKLSFAQEKIANNTEQILINKIQVSDLKEKYDLNEIQVQTLQKEILLQNKKIFELEERLKEANLLCDRIDEHYSYKHTLITWGLTILAILVTFFGVVVPIASFVIGRTMKKDLEKQSKEALESIKKLKHSFEEEISTFIVASKKRMKHLEEVGYFGQTVPPFSVKPCHFERCCNDTKY